MWQGNYSLCSGILPAVLRKDLVKPRKTEQSVPGKYFELGTAKKEESQSLCHEALYLQRQDRSTLFLRNVGTLLPEYTCHIPEKSSVTIVKTSDLTITLEPHII